MTEPASQLDPVLLTVADVMALTQLGRNVVYELLNTGQLRAIQVGRQYRVPRAEFDAWVERSTGSAARGRPAPIQFTPAARRGRKAASAKGGR